uniref:Reverse transcriptase domain-containing protein n=1 Tax=Oryzias latipes TaxID=8090 RepID=A0A3P9LEU6_ORYLA
MVLILQWNARSLLANGQELKKCIDDLDQKPDIICIQETWLRPNLDFRISQYTGIRCDRAEGGGGGCATFIKNNFNYRVIKIGTQEEFIGIEIYIGLGRIYVVNYYNPCKKLDLSLLKSIIHLDNGHVIVCGDFNAHSTLWGGKVTDVNGEVLEDLMDELHLVCLNDGRGTRIDVRTGNMSALDLTFVSNVLAGGSEWNIHNSTMGSDHYPVFYRVGGDREPPSNGKEGRWLFHKAKWDEFTFMCEEECSNISMESTAEEMEKKIRNLIISAAQKTIPRSKATMTRKNVPWWTEDCKIAVKNRNKGLKLLKRTHTYENLLNYKRLCAQARRTIKKEKREYWRAFCDKIGRTTPVNTVWGMIRKMKGIRRELQYPVLKMGDDLAISDMGKAEMLAKTFVRSQSNENLSGYRKGRRDEIRKRHYKEFDDNTYLTTMDAPFTCFELDLALHKSKITSPGRDGISYVMLKHLGRKMKLKLLDMYNRVWCEGKLPTNWKEAVVIPILKPGKDPSSPENYRPIALTSHVGKVMERMINERLQYYLESKNLLSPYQNGFRKGRGTMDPVICLEADIRKAQVNKEYLVAVFFDIEKAYDMVWKEGLLIKLGTLGLNGRIYNWIKGFLFDRYVQVRIGKSFSTRYVVDNGTPQGSVISPVLFSIMINDIFNSIGCEFGKALFADDGALWKRGRNIHYVERKIQDAITEVENWSYDWGFKFSVTKTKCMVFTRKRGTVLNLRLYGEAIEQVHSFRYLGVILDTKLKWRENIDSIVGRCKKVINIMRCLKGTGWGASAQALKQIYITMIRSVTDYGIIVYNTACKTLLHKIEVIQNQALKICTGAMRSTPAVSLQVEMGELPLKLRIKQLMLNYWVKIQGCVGVENMVRRAIEPCWESDNGTNESAAWKLARLARKANIHGKTLVKTFLYPTTPFWIFPTAQVDLYLHRTMEDRKGKGNWDDITADRLDTVHASFIPIYTDGSKDPETMRTGFSFCIPTLDKSVGVKTSKDLSVFAVEMLAISYSLHWLEQNRIGDGIICSDSLSALISLKSYYSESRSDILYEIYESLIRLANLKINIRFMWVPAHRGVEGNEMADFLAKRALKRGIEIEIPLGRTEFRAIIRRRIMEEWQTQWERERKGRHLFSIQDKVGRGMNVRVNTRDSCIISRLRMGHTGLNNTLHLIGKHPTGLCECGKGEESVEHVLCQCELYREERRQLESRVRMIEGEQMTLKKLLGGEENLNGAIIGFLKRTRLLRRI